MSREQDLDDFAIDRRRTLRILGEGAGCIAGASLLASLGCVRADAGRVAIGLADLPIGERVRVLDGENPVELLRTADGVLARSLWCTHSGCEVRWRAARQQYECPCHDGVFAADGSVLAGPPPRPLETYPIRVTDTVVLLGTEAGDRS